jgi:NADH-quinone oxidoreductase subunit L
VPHALGGANRIERFLEPSFEVSESARQGQRAAAAPGTAEANGSVQAASFQETHPTNNGGEDRSAELLLMAISSGIAIAGIGIAAYFWLRNRAAADRLARSMSGVYHLLSNKYYIDELYDAAIVQPIKLFSTGGLWKGMDAGIVDGAVNGVGLAVQAGSGGLRRIQTGSVRTYAGALFLGVVVILGFYLWR